MLRFTLLGVLVAVVEEQRDKAQRISEMKKRRREERFSRE